MLQVTVAPGFVPETELVIKWVGLTFKVPETVEETIKGEVSFSPDSVSVSERGGRRARSPIRPELLSVLMKRVTCWSLVLSPVHVTAVPSINCES